MQWVGIPFAEHGRGPDAFDCYGLVRAWHAHETGKDLPDYRYGEGGPDQARTLLQAIRSWRQTDPETQGAVLVFRICGLPRHCAVSLGGGTFLHVFRGRHTCVERLGHWRERLAGAYEWTG